MPTSTEKKISVDQAPLLAAMSFHVSTLVMRRIATPTKAAEVASTPIMSPNTHRRSRRAKVASMVHSPRLMEPSSLSSSRAWAGASGVFVRPGL
jgi:hypothetical protein